MKYLRIATVYAPYSSYFYEKNPGLAEKSYHEQKAAFSYDHFYTGDGYSRALISMGYEHSEIILNLKPMLRAWADENGISPDASPHEIAIEHAKRFKPDVIDFDMVTDVKLLERIRTEVPTVRLIFAREGCVPGLGKTWPLLDFVLSCAPETVEMLRSRGIQAEQIHHAFNPDLLNRLSPSTCSIPLSFIGSIIRRGRFSLERERLFLYLAKRLPITIYSPSVTVTPYDYIKAGMAGIAFFGVKTLKATRLFDPIARHWYFMKDIERIASFPRLPVNPKLSPYLKPGVFGLEYFQTLRNSLVSLNLQINVAPRYASNIRLFEATGVGSCLLTDWYPNLPELFVPDEEIVTFNSHEEACEKAKWLLDNPKERAAIAKRGQARTLRDHTCMHRAIELDAILRKRLRSTTVVK